MGLAGIESAELNQSYPDSSRDPAPFPKIPWLLLLFAASGCAALIYEIVWFQLLQLVIGSSAVSLGLLLGSYMGGLCLGSIAAPRVISSRLISKRLSPALRHPLRLYALIELGIGVLGIAVLFALPRLDWLYVAGVGHGLPGILLRGLVAALCLLPPTLLMGASLPVIARCLETTPKGVSWLGFLYGANIGGAVFGCLLAGFYLLRVYDMAKATYIAAAVNTAAAAVALALASRMTWSLHPADEPRSFARPPGCWPVYVAIGISGLCALGAEVIWTRLLSLLLGATVYTFSIILAVFLVGLGIGTGVGSLIARTTARPRFALGCCQLLLAAAAAWTAYTLGHSVPYWPINPLLAKSPWFNFEVDLMRCVWTIFPATCLWGASFPLALAAASAPGQDAGELVAEVYAANTVGAIVGAAGFSLFLIPWIGTQHSQQALILLCAIAALLVLMPLRVSSRASGDFGNQRREPALGTRGAVGLGVSIAAAILLAWSVSGVPWLAVAYGRRISLATSPGRLLYMGEGMNASVVISEPEEGKRYFHVSGKVEASTESYDMRLQRMLGHLPALLHSKPRSVLVVGFGAGVTAGTFVKHPGIERIVICEIEPLIPPAATRYFARENYNVLRDPRTKVVYDDARHFILTSRDKFDIITSDPIHPWVKGTSTLYSKEYFELVKAHLNPGGVVTQWVPLYESDLDTVKSELATFFDVFPAGTIWGNDIDGQGYDTVLLGQAEPSRVDLDQLQQRLARADHQPVAESLHDVAFWSGADLLATYAGRASDLRSWLEHAEINHDVNLRLQYLAGMGLNFDQPAFIYNQILSYRRFPEDLFIGSPSAVHTLRTGLRNRTGSP